MQSPHLKHMQINNYPGLLCNVVAHLKEEGFFFSQQNDLLKLLKLKCRKESNALQYKKARHWFSVGEQEFIKAALSLEIKKKRERQRQTIKNNHFCFYRNEQNSCYQCCISCTKSQ